MFRARFSHITANPISPKFCLSDVIKSSPSIEISADDDLPLVDKSQVDFPELEDRSIVRADLVGIANPL